MNKENKINNQHIQSLSSNELYLGIHNCQQQKENILNEMLMNSNDLKLMIQLIEKYNLFENLSGLYIDELKNRNEYDEQLFQAIDFDNTFSYAKTNKNKENKDPEDIFDMELIVDSLSKKAGKIIEKVFDNLFD